MPTFSEKSKAKLETCEQPLQDLFTEVIKHVDCTVLDGHRNEERQNKAFSEGNSKAKFPQSKHNAYPSYAVDVIPYPVDWEDIKRFHEFAGIVQGIASQMNIKIKWGGHFSWFDGPHYQLEK
ncbi:MAG: hypothetical protein ABUJ92_00045 [Desulfobacterales bacterium]